MKVVCAWCGKRLKGRRDDPETSHGMCRKCKCKMEKEMRDGKAG